MAHEELSPLNITPGAIRFNTDSMKLEYFRIGMEGGSTSSYAGIGTMAAGEWVQITTDTPDIQTGGTRGLRIAGYTAPGSGGSEGDIDYINLTTGGYATKWGDASGEANQYAGFSCSDRTRGVFGGGNSSSAHSAQVHVKYVEIATEGTVNDFGDTSVATHVGAGKGVAGNSTRGIIAGGAGNIIQYITIQTTGVFNDFGDLTLSTGNHSNHAPLCSPVRCLQAGGKHSGTSTDAISFITTATLGNTAHFGDLTDVRWHTAGCSNAIKGIIWNGMTASSGATGTNVIHGIELSSLGDAYDFGDTDHDTRSRGAAASQTRAVAFGGADPGINIIDYVKFASKGDAMDFGDLTQSTEAPMSASNGHGGLG
jgi:hypothetical protein|tara:strand:+ start:1944 stop:3047 length:1104 start_codon:yes stop_codon:yes gene_type:complete